MNIDIDFAVEYLRKEEHALVHSLKLFVETKDIKFFESFLYWYEKEDKPDQELEGEELLEAVLKSSRRMKLNSNGFYLSGKNKNVVRIEDGRYIYFAFGKYKPNLNILLNEMNLYEGLPYFKDSNLREQLDYTGEIEFLRGKYFLSKKGSRFFDLTSSDKPHILALVNWGGSFNRSRGFRNVPDDKIYYRKASSNGGGTGKDYLILPVDYSATYSIDDF